MSVLATTLFGPQFFPFDIEQRNCNLPHFLYDQQFDNIFQMVITCVYRTMFSDEQTKHSFPPYNFLSLVFVTQNLVICISEHTKSSLALREYYTFCFQHVFQVQNVSL